MTTYNGSYCQREILVQYIGGTMVILENEIFYKRQNKGYFRLNFDIYLFFVHRTKLKFALVTTCSWLMKPGPKKVFAVNIVQC